MIVRSLPPISNLIRDLTSYYVYFDIENIKLLELLKSQAWPQCVQQVRNHVYYII